MLRPGRPRLCNRELRQFPFPATLMDMAIQRNDTDEREARLAILIDRFRDAEKRALLKRGIQLWTRSERLLPHQPEPPATNN